MLATTNLGYWTVFSANPTTQEEWAAAHNLANWAWHQYNSGTAHPPRPHWKDYPSARWSLPIATHDVPEAQKQWSSAIGKVGA
jgi:hypothetical protein